MTETKKIKQISLTMVFKYVELIEFYDQNVRKSFLKIPWVQVIKALIFRVWFDQI